VLSQPVNVCQHSDNEIIFTASSYTGALEWTDTGGGTESGNSVIFGSNISGTVTVIARSAQSYSGALTCYSSTETKSAEVKALPDAPVLSQPVNVCQHSDNEIIFTASSYTGALEWTDTGGGTESGNSVTFGSNAIGTVTVIARSAQSYSGALTCRSATVTKSAEVKALPDAPVLSQPVDVCHHSDIKIIFTASSYTGTLEWTDTGGGTESGNSVTFGSNISGTVTVVARSAQSYSGALTCYSSTETKSAEVKALPDAPVLSQPADVCHHSDIKIIFTASSYTGELEWTDTGGGTESGNSVTFGSNAIGTVTVVARSAQSYSGALTCRSATVTKSAEVKALPDVAISGASYTCENSSTELTASGAVAYLWSTGETSESIMVNTPNTYTVTGTALNGCTATSAPQAITVYPLPPVPGITPLGATAFCAGGFVTLSAYAIDTVSYEWYKDGQLLTTGSSNSPTVSESGNYSAVSVDRRGCRSPQSAALQITVYPLPEVPVIITRPPFYVGFKYTLELQSPEENVRYHWHENNKNTGSAGWQYPLPDLQPGDTWIYFVEAFNTYGCRSRSDDLICTAEIPPLFIPNIFTPNNDGINDNFHIAGLEAYPENELRIIDKRGRMVYSKKNYYNEWYGGDLPTDTYYYFLILVDKQRTVSRHTGYVHLKRGE
ncbi:MAG: gliding motility-associated C-terminal domain-containing protein, partial [Prevotellaceae bacterium]|nr:gliding motility-associated C-terminal domain-containing protein [Prevotellaceae bacterium]